MMKISTALKGLILIALMTVLSTGCTSLVKRSDFAKFETVALPNAASIPTSNELSTKRIRVIVLPLNESAHSIPSGEELNAALNTNMQKALVPSGAEVVNRKVKAEIANNLRAEIRFAEQSGSGNYKGEKVADYVVLGEVLDGTVSKSHSTASTYKNDKGQTIAVPPSDQYVAEISVRWKIFSIPQLVLVNQFLTDYKDKTKVELVPTNTFRPTEGELLITAGKKAIDQQETMISNFFSPRAYIAEHRRNKKRSLVRISLGTHHGFKPGTKVRIYRREANSDPLMGGNVAVEYYASGVVSEIAEGSFAWIQLDEKTDVSKVHWGDVVRTHKDADLWKQAVAFFD